MRGAGWDGGDVEQRHECPRLRLLVLQLLIVVSVVSPFLIYGWFDGFGNNWLVRRPAVVDVDSLRMRGINLPEPTELAKQLLIRNSLPPRNVDLFPSLGDDRVIIVLYVHYRPSYLKLVVSALSAVHGINETLLIVSHDGFYEEMNAIVESIRFCQVRFFCPVLCREYRPHLLLRLPLMDSR